MFTFPKPSKYERLASSPEIHSDDELDHEPDMTSWENGIGATGESDVPHHTEPRSSAHAMTTTPMSSIHRNLSSPESSDLYTIFTASYPSYISRNGTIANFVKACICLEYLGSERALREYLYDDYIRAFSEGYQAYVAGSREDQEILPAFEWFNMLEGEPEYKNMVVTSTGLKSFLSMFPEEVASARRYIL